MNIDAISAAMSPETDSKSKTALSGLANDFNNFVTMLTVQLKNQDPSSPLDSNQFTQQLVAFTGVEQAVRTNDHLEKLVNMQQHSQLNEYVGYIGKDVEVDSSKAALANGRASFSYYTPEETTSIKARIFDQYNVLVSEEKIKDFIPGQSNKFVWDGHDIHGDLRTSGVYKIELISKDGQGNETRSVAAIKGYASGVTMKDNLAYLIVDNQEIPTNKVVSVNVLNDKNQEGERG